MAALTKGAVSEPLTANQVSNIYATSWGSLTECQCLVSNKDPGQIVVLLEGVQDIFKGRKLSLIPLRFRL